MGAVQLPQGFYGAVLRGQAMRRVIREVYLPDPVLGIGAAEDTSSHMIPFDIQPQPVSFHVGAIMDFNDIQYAGRGAAFTEDDFSGEEFYLGNMVDTL